MPRPGTAGHSSVLSTPACLQLERQELALAAAEERATAAEAALHKSQLDVACLKRGLELAAEQLTRSAGAEVPGTLLRAVARVRLGGGLAGGCKVRNQLACRGCLCLHKSRRHCTMTYDSHSCAGLGPGGWLALMRP